MNLRRNVLSIFIKIDQLWKIYLIWWKSCLENSSFPKLMSWQVKHPLTNFECCFCGAGRFGDGKAQYLSSESVPCPQLTGGDKCQTLQENSRHTSAMLKVFPMYLQKKKKRLILCCFQYIARNKNNPLRVHTAFPFWHAALHLPQKDISNLP